MLLDERPKLARIGLEPSEADQNSGQREARREFRPEWHRHASMFDDPVLPLSTTLNVFALFRQG
jgi:hypothetical protein